MGIFGQSKNVSAMGKSNPYPRAGSYIIELVRHAWVDESQKDKQPLAIVEYTVVDVLEDPGNANSVGGEVSAFFKLEVGGRDSTLTQVGEINMSRLKAYVAEMLGGSHAGISANDLDPEAIASAFGHEIDDKGNERLINGWDGTDVAGIRLHLRVVEGVSNKGAMFTNLFFTALKPAEE